jgi:hypothetical protein
MIIAILVIVIPLIVFFFILLVFPNGKHVKIFKNDIKKIKTALKSFTKFFIFLIKDIIRFVREIFGEGLKYNNCGNRDQRRSKLKDERKSRYSKKY